MKLVYGLIALLLAGCSSTAARLSDTDYTWTKSTTPASYQAAYRYIKEGAEKCEGTWHLDANLYGDIKEGRITISLKNAIFQNPQYVLAKVTISEQNNGAFIAIGVITDMDTNFAIKRETARKVSTWANGNLACQ